MNDVHYSHKTIEWETPQALFDELNAEFAFTLDPCATAENTKCDRYYTVAHDGLAQDWTGERVFCNPPYGRVMGQWIEKCASGGGGSRCYADTGKDGHKGVSRAYLS